MTNKKPKILFLDIETSYIIAKVWGLWKPTISPSQIVQDSYMLCASYSWLGEDKVHSLSCTKKEILACNDKRIVAKLCEQILEADLVVGHNVDKFDLKRIKSRVIFHRLPSINHIKTIDTLKSVRKNAGFCSNRLDHLGHILGVGRKIENTTGLWDHVMAGSMKHMKDMVKYCDQDVQLLKDVYIELRPYMEDHPQLSMITGNQEHDPCPACDSINSIKYGFKYKLKNKYQRYMCRDCGNSFTGQKKLC